MVPSVNDPKWKKAIEKRSTFDFKSLATKMLFMRVDLLVGDGGDAAKVQEAIGILHGFFVKNETIAADDLNQILK